MSNPIYLALDLPQLEAARALAEREAIWAEQEALMSAEPPF